LSEGSVISDDEDGADGSEGSHVNLQSPESPGLRKNGSNGHIEPINGDSRSSGKAFTSGSEPDHSHTRENGISDTDMMLNGLLISDPNGAVEEVHYDDLQAKHESSETVETPSVVRSSAQMDRPQENPLERRRREHEEYKSKRDADPAFVPNRGAFFMHDHRHAGPAANGFRPFGRGRGRGRAGIGGPFSPVKYVLVANLFHLLSSANIYLAVISRKPQSLPTHHGLTTCTKQSSNQKWLTNDPRMRTIQVMDLREHCHKPREARLPIDPCRRPGLLATFKYEFSCTP
jgi:hypothetical protein